MEIKITQKSDWARTNFGEVISIETIDVSDVFRFGKMKRYGRSGYLLVAQLVDGRYGIIAVSKQDKETQKMLNEIKSKIKRPSYPTAFDSVEWMEIQTISECQNCGDDIADGNLCLVCKLGLF